MIKKFPVLSFISILLRLLGYLVILPSLGLVWAGGIQPAMADNFGPENLYQLAGGVVGLFIALWLIAFGEIIGVLFAIEANTRKAKP